LHGPDHTNDNFFIGAAPIGIAGHYGRAATLSPTRTGDDARHHSNE
jgi:hypothetical protein